MWSIVDVCTNGEKVAYFSSYLKVRGVMEYHIYWAFHNTLIISKHPKGAPKNDVVIASQKVFMITPMFF